MTTATYAFTARVFATAFAVVGLCLVFVHHESWMGVAAVTIFQVYLLGLSSMIFTLTCAMSPTNGVSPRRFRRRHPARRTEHPRSRGATFSASEPESFDEKSKTLSGMTSSSEGRDLSSSSPTGEHPAESLSS